VIVVSCVTKDPPYEPHPHNLVGKDCKRGVCTLKVKDTNVIRWAIDRWIALNTRNFVLNGFIELINYWSIVYFLTFYPFWPLMLWVRIPLRRGVLNKTLCDKVCQWLAADLWFSPGTMVSSTNKTDRHDITEVLLKEALNTINQTYPFWHNTWR
jgi:hypothetical protein